MLYILVRYLAESGGPDHQRLKMLADHCRKVPEFLRLNLVSLWEEPENANSYLCRPDEGESEGTECECRKDAAPVSKEQQDEDSSISA